MPATAADKRVRESIQFQLGSYVMMFGALGAFLITSWRYVTPLSGVNGSGGAELTMVGEVALIFASFILLRKKHDFVRTIFVLLSWIGVVLTFIAALFLHGWFTALFLALCALGVVIETFNSINKKRG